jgi:hypothetical protein
MKRLFVAIFGLALLAGCQTRQPLYYWGNYEPLLYQSYSKPDKAPPQAQIDKLEEDLHKAASANRAVAPGVHAHLGYLYYRLGRLEDATRHFLLEKQKFPESAVFIDALLKAGNPDATSVPAATPEPAPSTP